MFTELILIHQLFPNIPLIFPHLEQTLSAYSEECLLKHNLHFIKNYLILATEVWVMSCNVASLPAGILHNEIWCLFGIKKQHCCPLVALVKQRNILHISTRTAGKTVLVPVFPSQSTRLSLYEGKAMSARYWHSAAGCPPTSNSSSSSKRSRAAWTSLPSKCFQTFEIKCTGNDVQSLSQCFGRKSNFHLSEQVLTYTFRALMVCWGSEEEISIV